MSKKMKKRQQDKNCSNCENRIYICEGDFVCEADIPVIIEEDWLPTNEYFWCGGKKWEEE